MLDKKMTQVERRAVISLSSIMSLRMIGLFMVLPMFTLYAHQLLGATPTLIGFAMGVYGLSQAFLQIPFGALSDRIGRRPVIVFGLLLFAAGSVMAALAHSITFMIIARALQGAGAVGSTILALMADMTREDQRTKAMAIAGMTIGASFMIAMLLGPVLTKWMPVSGLFYIAAFFGLVGIVLLYTTTPTPPPAHWHRDAEPELKSFMKLLVAPDLAILNTGIFILHAIFTASFVIIPISLHRYAGIDGDHQWHLYLPALLLAFVVSLGCIGYAERKQKVKPFFIAGIATLVIAEICLWIAPTNIDMATLGLCLFLTGFSLLEAFLPSLISRTAPASRKGSALGIYSCSQFLGIFVGGAGGGWLYGQFSLTGVYVFCMILGIFWLVLASFMQPPRHLVNQMLRLSPEQVRDWEAIVAKLRVIPGIVEVTFIAEDGVAYLKMERGATLHPDFIRLKENTI